MSYRCRATKRSKGIALAQFAEPSDAVDAHAALDGTVFQGRLLHVLPGHRPPPGPAETEGAQVRPQQNLETDSASAHSKCMCHLGGQRLDVWYLRAPRYKSRCGAAFSTWQHGFAGLHGVEITAPVPLPCCEKSTASKQRHVHCCRLSRAGSKRSGRPRAAPTRGRAPPGTRCLCAPTRCGHGVSPASLHALQML